MIKSEIELSNLLDKKTTKIINFKKQNDILIEEFLSNNHYLNDTIYRYIEQSDCIVIKYNFRFRSEYVINFYIYNKNHC